MTLTAMITAGGTREPIDDVRAVTNSSTGRFGAALANALVERGVHVTLLGSRSMLAHNDWLHPDVQAFPFDSYADLQDLLDHQLHAPPDLLFMAAAVSDFSPLPAEGKISSGHDTIDIRMVRNLKLLATLRDRCGDETFLVGFKLLSGVSADELVRRAMLQCDDYGLDLTVANDLAYLTDTLHPVTLVQPDDAPQAVIGTRQDVAHRVVDFCMDAVEARRGDPDGPELPCERAESRWLDAAGPVTEWWWFPTGLAPRAAWHGDIERLGETVYAHLASTGHSPHATVLRTPRGVLWGGTEGAWRRLQSGWSDITADSDAPADTLIPVFSGGRLTGVLDARGEARRPMTTALREPPFWFLDLLDELPAETELEVPTSWRQGVLTNGAKLLGESEETLRIAPPEAQEGLREAASVALLDRRTQRVLIGIRRLGSAAGLWALPGGACAIGESPQDAALRELREETGLQLPALQPWFIRRLHTTADDGTTWRIHCYGYRVLHRDAPAITEEFRARWLPLHDARNVAPVTAGTARVLADIEDRLQLEQWPRLALPL